MILQILEVGMGDHRVDNVYTLKMHVHLSDLVFHAKADKMMKNVFAFSSGNFPETWQPWLILLVLQETHLLY